MRIMALDYGSKRIGVALSDPTGTIASPLEFIPARPEDRFLARLREIIAEHDVGRIVLGMPRNMDGSYGPAAEAVRAFAEKLRAAIDLPLVFWDERLTTAMANRFLIEGNMSRRRRKEKVDQTAAAILLQSYLDSPASS
ncbi:MAG: Holliday junction resolvase RuvX [Verrucomicrobia bacterium]|nr:MAG: Holliday junction resolvase RuvX [Verrucomicrobiota bacterium]